MAELNEKAIADRLALETTCNREQADELARVMVRSGVSYEQLSPKNLQGVAALADALIHVRDRGFDEARIAPPEACSIGDILNTRPHPVVDPRRFYSAPLGEPYDPAIHLPTVEPRARVVTEDVKLNRRYHFDVDELERLRSPEMRRAVEALARRARERIEQSYRNILLGRRMDEIALQSLATNAAFGIAIKEPTCDECGLPIPECNRRMFWRLDKERWRKFEQRVAELQVPDIVEAQRMRRNHQWP